MKSERWARLKDLLDQALDLPQDQRDAFVDRECKGDVELKEQLVELLAASEDLDDFISPPKDHVIPVDKIFSSANEEGLLGSIGGFRLIQELGRGGRGVVYLAKPEDSDRLVALKVLSLTALPSAVSVERFQREARSVEKLQHPAIVKIQSLQQDLGRPFLVMDYIDGPSLAAEIAKLQPGAEVDQPSVLRAKDEEPSFLAAKLIEELARAAHHAHERGVIHRDIKPQNVLLDHEGQPYLVDFGLARDEEEATLTRPGEVEGTPNYMSPEQVRAERNKVDQRTDVYSLGVVLYELLTLKRPFEAPTANQVMANITSRAPMRVRKINESVPRDLELVCMKAMEKNPRHRYQTAAELADDLGRFLRHEGVHATALNPAQMLARHIARRPMPWALGAAAGFIFTATFWVTNLLNRAEAFGIVADQIEVLDLTEGVFEPVPDLASVFARLEVVVEQHGKPSGRLASLVADMERYQANAKDHLARKYLPIQRISAGIGYWIPEVGDDSTLTDPEERAEFAASMGLLGFAEQGLGDFDTALNPQLSITLRGNVSAAECRLYFATYRPAVGDFGAWREWGQLSEIEGDFSLQPDTPYRLLIRHEGGRFAECSVLPMPMKSRRELVIGLREPNAHARMVSVSGGEYAWDPGMEVTGGPSTLEPVSGFWADEYLVTFRDYYAYLEASGNSQYYQWPVDETLIAQLLDRPAVFLPVSDMAAYAAWHGKRLISVSEHMIAARGVDLPRHPPSVTPEIGHPSMEFPTLQINQLDEGSYPKDWGVFWSYMARVLPSVNAVPDFDQGPSGMKMVWASVKQATDTPGYASSNGYSPTPSIWSVGFFLTRPAEETIQVGLTNVNNYLINVPESYTGFRCALSDNSIP